MSADVGLEMYKGSLPGDYVTLSNYYGKAYASDGGSDNPYPYGVGAIQTADSGSADSIRIYNHANDGSGLLSIDTYFTGKSGTPASFSNLDALSQAGTDNKVTQKAHLSGDFTSTSTSGTDSKTRTSDYGTEYDLDMQAVKGSVPTGILGYYVDPSMADFTEGKGAIEGAASVAQSGDTINAASGSYTDNLLQSSFENIKLVGAGADTTHTASFTLNNPLNGMIAGITGDIVNVADPNAKIQDGIDLVTQDGLVNVGAGEYDEDVNINKDLTLKGSGDPTANSFSLTNGAILGTGSGGITALKTIVNEGSKIQDGITLVSQNGEVDVNAGTYSEEVDINKDLTLIGIGDPTATSFTLNAKLGTGSGGITAPTVNVNPTAKIQDGITLASSGGAVNVAAGNYAEDVDINKGITLKGEGEATTTANSFSLTNGAILGGGSGGISAPTVTVNPNSKITDGILLSSKDVFVKGATGYTYSDDLTQDFYGKGITLTGVNNPVTNSISLNQPVVAGKMSGIGTNTVNILNDNAKIQDGVNIVSSGGTVNVAAGTYYENVKIDKSMTVAGFGASNDKIIVSGDANKDGYLTKEGTVFTIGENNRDIDVALSGITITGGDTPRNGVILGGGIANYGRLMVTDCIISGNIGSGIFNFGKGAGGAEAAKATVTRCTISGNTDYQGGGISNGGTLIVTDSTISGNRGINYGGGITNSGMATIVNSIISGNRATNYCGGGIDNEYGTLVVTDSMISDNYAGTYGGGIYNRAVGEVTIHDSTISGNTGTYGGGLYIGGGTYDGGILSVSGTSQIINNKARTGYGGGIYFSGKSLTLDGSQVAVNSNQAYLPITESGWYQGWGVYSTITPATPGFDPSKQVTGNTHLV